MATMKVGVTYPGPPRSPDSYSGVRTGPINALERIGVSVTAIDSRLVGARERLVRGVLGLTMLITALVRTSLE